VLAAAYAERHRADYRATWWIRAESEPAMRADLAGLGVRLGWVAPDEKEEPAIASVIERLRHEGEGILLIYDNALSGGTIRPYLPPGGAAKVIVTSNAPAWRGIAEPVEIRLWPKEIGADFLIVRTGRTTERQAAEDLSEALGGLPLAHEQAAAYCERLALSLAEYRRRFDAAPARLLDTERDAPAEYHDRLTVAKTFALAIDEAARLHPAAEPLLIHAALLAPEPIPLFLFSEAREKFGEPLASALAGDGLDEAVAALRTFALVDRETIVDERDPAITTDTIRLHRLVRAVAAARRAGEAREDIRRALVEAFAAVYPLPLALYDDPKTWPRARRLDAVALALVRNDSEPLNAAEWPASVLLNRLATYQRAVLAAYVSARLLYERALAIREKALGPDHPDTAASLINLAGLLYDQGELAAARPLYERAVEIWEKVRGPDHPDTATILENLAQVLQKQGEFSSARPLRERALAIREGARTRPSLDCEEPRTCRRGVTGAGRTRRGATAVRARIGDLRECARTRPSQHRRVPTQSWPASSNTPRTCRGAAALRARAGDPREGARPRPSRYRGSATEPNCVARAEPLVRNSDTSSPLVSCGRCPPRATKGIAGQLSPSPRLRGEGSGEGLFFEFGQKRLENAIEILDRAVVPDADRATTEGVKCALAVPVFRACARVGR
jgi:tetratricopeptide (TPR) repeat protein